MGLDQAIADVKRFTQNGFSREIVFTTPDGQTTATVRGLVSKHNLSINPDTGVPVNSRNTHIYVVESVLTDEDYTTRDANDEIDLKRHRVTWTDASETSYTYLIDEVMPSHTVGLLVMTLGDLS